MGVRRVFEWYFHAPSERRTFIEIVKWWEIRRIPYNIVIGIVGFISLILFLIFADATKKIPAGEDVVEPISILIAPFMFNICYTFGELYEIALGGDWEYNLGKQPSSTMMLKVGFLISLGIVLFPSVYWGIYLLLLRMGCVN